MYRNCWAITILTAYTYILLQWMTQSATEFPIRIHLFSINHFIDAVKWGVASFESLATHKSEHYLVDTNVEFRMHTWEKVRYLSRWCWYVGEGVFLTNQLLLRVFFHSLSSSPPLSLLLALSIGVCVYSRVWEPIQSKYEWVCVCSEIHTNIHK